MACTGECGGVLQIGIHFWVVDDDLSVGVDIFYGGLPFLGDFSHRSIDKIV